MTDFERKSEEMDLGLMCKMGEEAFHEKEWFLMKEWLDLALEKIGDLEVKDGCKRKWIIDFLSYAEYQVSQFMKVLRPPLLFGTLE